MADCKFRASDHPRRSEVVEGRKEGNLAPHSILLTQLVVLGMLFQESIIPREMTPVS